MNKAPINEYEEMKSFLGAWMDRSGLMKSMPAEVHPLAVLERIEKDHGLSKAKQGLKMAVNDCLEEASYLEVSDIKKIDAEFSLRGIPSVSKMRQRYSRRYQTILKRNRIMNEVEYYLLKGIIDSNSEELSATETQNVEAMMRDYEIHITQK